MKYIKNFIIISIIGFLSIHTFFFNINLSIYIPLVVFLVFLNPLNALFILPSAIFASIYQGLNLEINIIITSIIPFIFRNIFIKTRINQLSLVLLLTMISYQTYNSLNGVFNDYITFIMFSFLTLVIYYSLSIGSMYFKTDKHKLQILNLPYIEAIFVFFCILGSSILNYYALLFLSVLTIMYFSAIKQTVLSFIFSLGLCYFYIFIQNDLIGYILPIISLIYLIQFASIILLSLLAFVLYSNNIPVYNNHIYTMFLALLNIELYKLLINKNGLYQIKNSMNVIYENIIENVKNQVLGYASFLDGFTINFTESKDYKIKINQGFKTIIDQYCIKCEKKTNCLKKEKLLLYDFIKLSLENGKEVIYKNLSNEQKGFINRCIKSNEIIMTANYLKNKYNLDKKRFVYEETVNKQIYGVSNILRQYAVDINNTHEIKINKFIKFKNTLHEYGYNVILFDMIKIQTYDFLLEIGISNIKPIDAKEIVKKIAENIFNQKVSIIIKKYENSRGTYFSVVQNLKYNVTYGHGSLAKEGLNISGDNYLIKDLPNGNFVAAISDGMGSGYSAFNESKATLKMINNIYNSNMSTNASINILNTFYSLKDQLDYYATLDLLEINKSSGTSILYKMGGSQTYILRGNSILETVSNDNLPFGIEDFIVEKSIHLYDKDIVILISDGVIEKISNVNKFEEYINLISHKNPQRMVYDILNYSIKNFNNKVIDDMSVVVLKIEKNIT